MGAEERKTVLEREQFPLFFDFSQEVTSLWMILPQNARPCWSPACG